SIDQIVQLIEIGGARDRGSDAGAREQPSDRHLRRGRSILLCDLVERGEDAEAALVEILLVALSALALGQVRLRTILSTQKARRQREIRDHSQPVGNANRLEVLLVVGV